MKTYIIPETQISATTMQQPLLSSSGYSPSRIAGEFIGGGDEEGNAGEAY